MALGIPMAMVLGSAIGAGGSILGGMMGDDEVNIEDLLAYKKLPDYPEAESARSLWGDTITQWGESGDYGATDMNWDEIFSTAKNKLNRYYWGGVGDTGLAGKVKASAARRGVSDSPALETELSKMGMQQSIDLNDLFSDLTTQKAQYKESARNNWLTSMTELAKLKPAYITGTGTTGGSTYGAGSMIGDVSSGIGSLFSQYAQSQQMEDFYNQLLEKYSGGAGETMPTTTQSSLFGNSLSSSEIASLKSKYPSLLANY